MVAWVRNTLCDRGAIDRTVRGTWVITETGLQMVEPQGRSSLDEDDRTKGEKGQVVPLGNPLYHRLRTTAHSGLDATAFEEALAEAFRVLGFDAVKIGGRGDTDIRVTAPLGKQQYIAIVDAKSSRTGKVADTALHYPSLHDHREKNQADYVMVVAPSFTRGNSLTHAEREHVVLMEVESFLAILDMHEHTPLSLYTLREMFTRPGLYGAAPDHLREAHEHAEQLVALLPLIVQKIEQWYTLHHVDAVNADSLFIAFIEHFGPVRYPKELIDAALAYLASPFIGALRKNDVGYYLTMPSRTVYNRLLRLGAAFQPAPASVSTRREAQADDARS
jgi:Restriction endonuclease